MFVSLTYYYGILYCIKCTNAATVDDTENKLNIRDGTETIWLTLLWRTNVFPLIVCTTCMGLLADISRPV